MNSPLERGRGVFILLLPKFNLGRKRENAVFQSYHQQVDSMT